MGDARDRSWHHGLIRSGEGAVRAAFVIRRERSPDIVTVHGEMLVMGEGVNDVLETDRELGRFDESLGMDSCFLGRLEHCSKIFSGDRQLRKVVGEGAFVGGWFSHVKLFRGCDLG